MDFTGCGNALNLRRTSVLQMVMDSLRYWVKEMHVDGFRFDLATTLARGVSDFNNHGAFLEAAAQDPVLSQVKLIAEPWDVGDNGYQLGAFPPGWAEWNDQYRDVVRRFWKGDKGMVSNLASRITASSDIFNNRGRRAWSSINFITAHDGFTLQDLVSYEHKHNEANQEGNRDGTDANYSANYGQEGETDDPEIQALRLRQKKNFLATLLLSEGTPMITAGDEFGRTQGGNNNAYCQDNEISWVNWNHLEDEDINLKEFTRRLIKLRSDHIVFHRYRFFRGEPLPGTSIKDITWLRPDGQEMTPEDWGNSHSRSLSYLLSGEAGEYHLTARGEPESDDTFLVILNADLEDIRYRLTALEDGLKWRTLFDTYRHDSFEDSAFHEDGSEITVKNRSFVLMVRADEKQRRSQHQENPAA